MGLINSSGVKVNSYSYDPYGKQMSIPQAVSNPWRYAAGFYHGVTGLTKFGARYYNGELGRFTQPDPSGKDLPYAYAGCNPVNNTDPSGNDTCSQTSLWLGIVSFGVGLASIPLTGGLSAALMAGAYSGPSSRLPWESALSTAIVDHSKQPSASQQVRISI